MQSAWMSTEFEAGLVSIIIPTHNRAQLITNALESIRRQSYRSMEVLVVDDGSDDGTDAVVSSWIAHNADARIRATYVQQQNRGAPAARNEGLRRSRGEFIQFLDSDDVILPGKLEVQVAALQSAPVCAYAWSDRERASLDVVWDVYAGLVRAKAGTAPPAPQQVVGYDKRRVPNQGGLGIYRRSACMALGPWDEGLARHQDWELNLRLIASEAPVLYVAGEQYISVNHSGPRVFGTANDTGRKYQLYMAACQTAEQRLIGDSSATQAARHKIAIIYLSAALVALERGQREQFDSAMRGFRRNHRGATQKLNGLVLSSAQSLFGMRSATKFARAYRRLKRL